MRARLLWALLLLAAVFSMHGLSCVAADSEMTGMTMPASTSVSAGGPESAAGGMVLALEHGASAAQSDPGHSAGDPDGHGSAAHVLTVCLAVLAGGVGVVLAVLAAWSARRRLLTTCTRATGAVRVVVDRAVACAPTPELSRLCVLRV
ncbi:MAG: hypothetical protein JWQ53_3252 [Klenkia sp.]|nr:hypothetical protein [Klenkia sp.]